MFDYSAKLSLKDKVVVVTGASGQLGSEICRGFSSLGAVVLGIDKQVPQKENRFCADFYECDLVQKQQVFEVLEKIVSRYERIDVLVNNAGVSCFEAFEERSEESFDWVMDVNLKGTFWCIQSFSKLAQKLKFSGSIINIGSIYGIVSSDFRIYTDCPRKNAEVYGATKAGIIQMTRYFAVHLAQHGIRVNCVSPGGIRSLSVGQGDDFVKNYSMRTPMGRMANVEEIVGGILYFASDLSTYTTGQNLAIDGGFTSW